MLKSTHAQTVQSSPFAMFVEMTLDNWLTIAETAVLAVTLGFIVWYTIETYRLRKATEEQVSLMKQQHDMLWEKWTAEIDPHFTFIGITQAQAEKRAYLKIRPFCSTTSLLRRARLQKKVATY